MRPLLPLLLLAVAAPASAKPMMPATPEQAAASPLVVVAEYLEREPGPVTYFGGARARYRVLSVLKGGKLPERLTVAYAFQDGSACMEESGWSFSEKLLPAPGSKWILFLSPSGDGASYATYRGDYGRWEASEPRLAQVRALLAK